MDNSTPFDNCVSDITSRNVFIAWFTVYLLLLPVFLLVLYVCFTKWRRPRASASGGGLSHSDVFTLNMVAMEMINIVGSCCVCYAYSTLNAVLSSFAGDTVVTTSAGQVLFHGLTCVERYLAVVHPVTYMRLRGEGGVTVRNIGIGLVWVFSAVYTFLYRFIHVEATTFYLVVGLFLSIAPMPLVTYCSVYVLCVLTRPKPGERGGNKKEIDQSKRSTVYTMVAILGVLLLRLITGLVCNGTFLFPWLGNFACVIMISGLWSNLPSSLVLPLLFLQRSGKLVGC